MRIENEIKLDFDDVLIRPKRSSLVSRQDVYLKRTFDFLHNNHTWTGTPIMAANMDSTGTLEMAAELSKHNLLTALHKHYSSSEISAFLDSIGDQANALLNGTFFSIGTSMEELNNARYHLKNNFTKIMIDVANGYSEKFVDHIMRVRDLYPDHIICAGNVVTAEMTEAIVLAGADIVKVGIGSGSVCRTRTQTGVGYPQLSAVIECADAAHGLKAHIISDGGCNGPDDFAKAFGAGADFVMSGSFFAGHEEGGGEIIEPDGVTSNVKQVMYYGMSSKTAQDKHNGGLSDYRSSEGRTVVLDYKGRVEESIKDLLGGLRSTCTYVGAQSLKDLPKRTTFIRVNNTHNRIFEHLTIGN